MTPQSAGNLSIAVLISGGGTTLKNLIDRRNAGKLPVDFKLVVSSKSNARGLEFAEASAIPSEVVSRKDFTDPNQHSDAVFRFVPIRKCRLRSHGWLFGAPVDSRGFRESCGQHSSISNSCLQRQGILRHARSSSSIGLRREDLGVYGALRR